MLSEFMRKNRRTVAIGLCLAATVLFGPAVYNSVSSGISACVAYVRLANAVRHMDMSADLKSVDEPCAACQVQSEMQEQLRRDAETARNAN